MTPKIKKINTISQIVRLKRLVKCWKHRSYSSSPPGSIGILVGSTRIRFVIPTRFLNLPVFVDLLNQTEEEFGYQMNGPLAVHCEPGFFREVLRFLEKDEQRFRGVGLDGFFRLVSEMDLEDQSKCKESCGVSAFTPLLSKAKA